MEATSSESYFIKKEVLQGRPQLLTLNLIWLILIEECLTKLGFRNKTDTGFVLGTR